MDEQFRQRILSCPTLPSLPTIAVEVLDLAQKEEVDLQQIAQTITRDPAMAGKILKTVNSSFYGRSQAVSTVTQALVIMGLQSVKTLVLGFSLVSNLAGQKENKAFDHVKYWRGSIYAATASRVLGERAKLVQQEEAFLATLLKDIGMLVLDRVLGNGYDGVWKSVESHRDLPQAELQMLGATHAEIGAMIAESWKLPPVLIKPIAHHHDPSQVDDPALKKLTEVVYLSSRCADVFVDREPAQALAQARAAIMEYFSCGEPVADGILEEIGKKTREVAGLFEINIGPAADFASILKKANEALVEITLQSQAQATQLQQQNAQLKIKATTDRLTGLANRAHFDEFLAEQFTVARQSKKPLSLVLIDVDKFKSVNDRYGHPTGDAVLKVLGALLSESARPGDLAARYGGEEMALILPATPRQTAAAVAETLRLALQSQPISYAGQSLTVTASFGVAALEPGVPFTVPAHIIKAADLALYKAKHGGRNNVKVFAMPAAKAV